MGGATWSNPVTDIEKAALKPITTRVYAGFRVNRARHAKFG
jgi:hypothetical protein